VEWAHAIAPDARIVVLESPVDETEGVQGLPEFLQLERYALRHHLVDVFTQSWAATEDTLFDARGRAMVAQLHRFYADAAAQGVTVVAASGDDGAAGPELSLKKMFPYPVVGYPASDPLVLAVGGTRLRVGLDGRVPGRQPGRTRPRLHQRGAISPGGVTALPRRPA
jgi:subtilase family serine protease